MRLLFSGRSPRSRSAASTVSLWLYSRGGSRDDLDVDAIRAFGWFTDEQLVATAAERDAGFEVGMFARQLAAASRLQLAQVTRYGVTVDQLQAMKARYAQWAVGLRG